MSHTGQSRLNYNMDSLNIKTWGVELAIKPIIRTITSLMNTERKPRRKKGCSKRSRSLVLAVEVATANFVEKGEIIAEENSEAKHDILTIVGDIRGHGHTLVLSAREFALDPCSTVKRGVMVRAAQALVSSVTSLLILADMLDVHLLMMKVEAARQELERMREVGSQQDLMEWMRRLEAALAVLSHQAGLRQRELKDSVLRSELGAARSVVRRQTALLLTSCNVSVRYPDLVTARDNRDSLHRQICSAVSTIHDIASGNYQPPPASESAGSAEPLMILLTELRDRLQNNPAGSLAEQENWGSVAAQLEQIIRKSLALTKNEIMKADSKRRITKTCDELQVILDQRSGGSQTNISSLEKSLKHKINLLMKLLRKTAADEVSETFIDSLEPVNQMLSSARKGSKDDLVKSSQQLEDQIEDFKSLAETICETTQNQEGRSLLLRSLTQLIDLKTKLSNAINIFSEIPDSKAAQENVQMFKKCWVEQVKIFMDAVDDVVCINYFLAVVENNVLEDVKRCCRAMENRSRAIYQRCGRLCDVVTADMERFEPGVFTQRVLESVRVLRQDIMMLFSRRVSEIIKSARNKAEIDENEFIDACRMIYDGVRDVRYNYTVNVDCEEGGLDSDMEEAVSETEKKKSVEKEKTTIQEAVSKIQTEKICADLTSDSPVYWVAVWSNPEVRNLLSTADLGGSQVDGFQEEKEKLDREVAKWEDNNNDIIVLAKHMCSIMTDMTDFIKGRGKLKTTTDIIDSARKISDAGKKLDVLARKIAERCPSSTTKSDLLAYLGRITLYCHQLTITSKVKADVHNVSGELVVSGLDSAMSLIQAAKNLMNAVVLTVKASYVGSRMYRQTGDSSTSSSSCPPSPVVVWKMRTPEKLPLVRREHPEEFRAKVRKGATTRQTSPVKALSEFQQRFHDLSTSSSVSSVDSQGQLELDPVIINK